MSGSSRGGAPGFQPGGADQEDSPGVALHFLYTAVCSQCRTGVSVGLGSKVSIHPEAPYRPEPVCIASRLEELAPLLDHASKSTLGVTRPGDIASGSRQSSREHMRALQLGTEVCSLDVVLDAYPPLVGVNGAETGDLDSPPNAGTSSRVNECTQKKSLATFLQHSGQFVILHPLLVCLALKEPE